MLPIFPLPLSSLHANPAGLQPRRALGQGLSTLAGAVLLSLAAMAPLDAHALALGRLVVQSALGEPLRAEIDLAQITAAEASSLSVSLAPVASFRAAGLEFNPGLTNVSIKVQRRADGRAYLQVTGSRAVNEPYLDLILEANWASGRIVRDYTLLLDPPKTPAATVVPAPEAVAAVALPPPPMSVDTLVQTKAAPVQSPPAGVKTQKTAAIQVRTGDTAGRIASTHKPATVSLEQMLVAMLRGNPNAFISNNINRIKAGSTIELPDAQMAGQVDALEARQIISAQSSDFDAYRRRLANSVPTALPVDKQRQATGKVQAETADRKATAPAADKLKLSKSISLPGNSAEEKIAQERQAQASNDRAAELTRNIAELAKLNTSTSKVAVPAEPAPAPAPAADPAPAPTTQSITPPVASPPEPSPAPPPAEPKAAPVVAATAPATASPPPQEPAEQETSFLDEIINSPLMLPAAGGLIALLAGFGVWRWNQRKKHAGIDSNFSESKLQPDSFFGVSGGQNVNTSESGAPGSSMMYSPSQLDAGGDVDPVTEADVYMAYGRDLQAEEILKEALRTNPSRVAIHSKMLEIYAKRRDVKSFEVLACEVYALVQGTGPSWEHACQLGQFLDPANSLYQPGGSPAQLAGGVQQDPDVPPGMANTRPFEQPADDASPIGGTASLDLDLDFSIDDTAKPASDSTASVDTGISFDLDDNLVSNTPAGPQAEQAVPPLEINASDLSFDLDEALPSTAPGMPAHVQTADDGIADFELSFTGENLPPTQPEMPAPVAPSVDSSPMSFDLGDLSLDLDGAPGSGGAELDDLAESDPLETKLSLAAEFLAIGDMEGARSLAEEVMDQATGALQAKASAFLADLG